MANFIQNDELYRMEVQEIADTTGRVSGGVVPTRKAITLEMVVCALAHPPSCCREVYDIDEPFRALRWIERGKRLASWQTTFSKQLLGRETG